MTKNYDARCGADVHRHVPVPAQTWNDPTMPDEAGDATITVSTRGLVRLALVASEVGARFQREAVGHDAMAWMLTPRRLFDGKSAITACLDLARAMRAVLLHGLGIGLDASPEDIDELTSEDGPDDVLDAEDEEEEELLLEAVEAPRRVPPSADVVPIHPNTPRLFTAIVIDESTDEIVHAFEAVVAPTSGQARSRIRSRHGDRIADAAEIREGFDKDAPLIEALVSPAVSDMLQQVARDPASPLAKGLEVAVVQRFAE